MHFYYISGLRVASELKLPGLTDVGAQMGAQMGAQGDPAVTIRMGPVPEHLPDARSFGRYVQIAGKQFLLRIPNVARFLLDDGREITCEPLPGGNAGELPIYAIGPAFGILLHQRGLIVLHASAVAVGGKAVLFCGQSGAGKSTTAATLVRRGYPLVSEDICAMTVSDADVPVVQPDGRRLRLWTQAIENLDLGDDRGDRVQHHEEKFYIEGEVSARPLPLGAIYVLCEAPPSQAPSIERLTAVDVAAALQRFAFKPYAVKRLGRSFDYFHAATSVATKTGSFFLKRPLDFTALPQIVRLLEGHWRDVGLLEKAA